MTFGHCPIIHGNSGSPAFDESGKLVAIMQGYFEPKPDSDFLGTLNQLKLDSKFGTLAVGTQLQCISELNQVSARQCFDQARLSPVNVQGYMNNQASLIQLPEVMSDGVMQSTVSEVWMRLKNSSVKQPVYVKVPTCFQQQNTVFEIRKYSLGINRYYQAEYRNQNKSDFIYFSAKKSLDSNEMRLTSEIGEVQIPVCPVTAI